MDQHHLAVVTRSLTRVPSRRDVLRGLAGAGLGLMTARLPESAEAKKKRKKKLKKPGQAKPNAFGCLNVGAACNSADQCCSGICEGKTCRAHDAGICRVDYDLCTTGAGHVCGVVNEVGTTCACVLTTGNAPFCGHFENGTSCRDCRQDTDCEDEFGQGAACVIIDTGICEGNCAETGGIACVPRCPKPAK